MFMPSYYVIMFTSSCLNLLVNFVLSCYTTITTGLKDLLRKEMSSRSNIATILVSKTRSTLHEIFSAPSGWHFIGKSLVVRPPDSQAREDIARALLAGLSCKLCESCELR